MPIADKPPPPPPDLTTRWLRRLADLDVTWGQVSHTGVGRLYVSGEPAQLLLTNDGGRLGAELVLGGHPDQVEVLMTQRTAEIAVYGELGSPGVAVRHDGCGYVFRLSRDNGHLVVEACAV